MISDENIREKWKELKDNYKLNLMSDKFNYVIKKFSVNSTNYQNEWIFFKIENKSNSFCICSKIITCCIYIKNSLNGNILRIGNECVTKLSSVNKSLGIHRNHALKQFKYRQNGLKNKRPCQSCGNHRISIDEPEWKTVCKSCYKAGLKNKTDDFIFYDGKFCINCKKQNIQKGQWGDYCNSCYRDLTKSAKKCSCGKALIGYSSRYDKCYRCYKKSLSSNIH